MNQDNLIENIYDAIFQRYDSLEFRDLLFGNTNLTRNHPAHSQFLTKLVRQVSLSNSSEMIEVLAEFFESEAENDVEQKQLIAAVLQGNLERAEFLLKNGLKIVDVGKEWEHETFGLPALYTSVLYRETKSQKEMLRLLIKHGLNIHIKINDSQYNLYHILALIVSHGAASEIAEVLFDSGLSEINQANLYGESPLQYAIFCKSNELAKFLINKGADFKRNQELASNFPLTSAFAYLNYEMVDLLLTLGADVNARDNSRGWTALHYVCQFQLFDRPKAIKLMLKKGIDVDIEDNDGRTPFFLMESESDSDNYQECLVMMVKELAKSTRISKKNMDFIQSHPMAEEQFNKCLSELSEMKNKKFYAPYSYYAVLKMSKKLKKLANLTKNEKFVAAFEEDDLTSFPLYADDLRTIFEVATRIRDESLKIWSYLKSVFGDFFPDLILDVLAKNLNVQDIKLE